MLTALKAGLGWLVQWLLGRLTAKHDPTAIELSDSNARAQERGAQAEKTIAIHEKAAAARADADARVLHEQSKPAPADIPGATSGIDADPDGNWRD